MQNQSSQPVRVRLFVSGLVQGVGYRYSTMNQAKYFGLSGWVRNLPDGRVEAVFEGDKKAVEGMIDWCRGGPTGATVSELVLEYEDPEGDRTFEIRR
ncbi:acylphosphatase [Microcoleus asticus]|uniref:acylphosphatase n=1 Tax=Microcoleus asticus IPMA8 TaxID=2563858 RepID=A0ABX2CYB9_9CYAN|nr:acylphosphatase [Microcoleus asticus]NQE35286.1 Acylphosphatase [Microcoleus asticus IPMA8]